jgi:DNA-binding transcriptional LysR family regulator
MRHTSRKRSAPDPLAPVNATTWLVVRNRLGFIEGTTPSSIFAYDHVAVNYLGNEDGLVDGYFSERGVMLRVHMELTAIEAPQRLGKAARIAVRVPHFWCIPHIIMRTDMVASVPRRLASQFATRFGLTIIEDPFGPYKVTVEAIWHHRAETDRTVTWLRDQIAAAAESLQ